MSYNIRNIREISNDPLTKFANQLAKKLSKFITDQQTEKLENKEDIYSNAQDIDTVLRFQTLNSTKYFDFFTDYYPPIEPDGDKLRLWFIAHNIGNTTRDWSETPDKTFNILGDPLLIDGTPFDLGIHTGGTKSLALKFNRPISSFVNTEHLRVPDTNDLHVAGISTGISYFMRFRIHSLATQGGLNRTLFQKIDDSIPADAAQIEVSPEGRLIFHLTHGGVGHDWETAIGTISTNTVYDVWCTYAVSGNVIHIYVNGVDKTLTGASAPGWQSDRTNDDLYIFRKGAGTNGGYTYGDLYDFRLYREKVVSAAEVGYMYTNKWTISDIPFGKVIIANYFSTSQSSSLTSFTSTSFTSTSFTT